MLFEVHGTEYDKMTLRSNGIEIFFIFVLTLKLLQVYVVALLRWVPWAPGNPPILEQWVLELINFGNEEMKCTQISQKKARNWGWEIEIAFGNPSLLILNGATERTRHTAFLYI